jgi:hypothetical protein
MAQPAAASHAATAEASSAREQCTSGATSGQLLVLFLILIFGG